MVVVTAVVVVMAVVAVVVMAMVVCGKKRITRDISSGILIPNRRH